MVHVALAAQLSTFASVLPVVILLSLKSSDACSYSSLKGTECMWTIAGTWMRAWPNNFFKRTAFASSSSCKRTLLCSRTAWATSPRHSKPSVTWKTCSWRWTKQLFAVRQPPRAWSQSRIVPLAVQQISQLNDDSNYLYEFKFIIQMWGN